MPKNNNTADTEAQEEVIDTRKPVIVNVPRIPGKPNYVVVWVNEENWKIKRGGDAPQEKSRERVDSLLFIN